jgi:hypothetical protein
MDPTRTIRVNSCRSTSARRPSPSRPLSTSWSSPTTDSQRPLP